MLAKDMQQMPLWINFTISQPTDWWPRLEGLGGKAPIPFICPHRYEKSLGLGLEDLWWLPLSFTG